MTVAAVTAANNVHDKGASCGNNSFTGVEMTGSPITGDGTVISTSHSPSTVTDNVPSPKASALPSTFSGEQKLLNEGSSSIPTTPAATRPNSNINNSSGTNSSNNHHGIECRLCEPGSHQMQSQKALKHNADLYHHLSEVHFSEKILEEVLVDVSTNTKPFKCTQPGCEFTSMTRSALVPHVGVQHRFAVKYYYQIMGEDQEKDWLSISWWENKCEILRLMESQEEPNKKRLVD